MKKLYFMTFIVAAFVFVDVNADCDVKTEKGECCVFPFKYKGEIYHSCTFTDRGPAKPWCSLTSNYDDDKKFGFCKFKTCQIKTTNGDCCVFPFTYYGVSHHACTQSFDSNPWCGTKSKVEFWTREPRGSCRAYVEPCFENPCQNNGICHSDKDRFYCNCTEGYKGKTCTEEVLPCESSPCEHGGTCENNGDQFKCQCLEGYTGDTCASKIVDPCKSSPCQNEAKCFSDLSKEDFYCSCPDGYEGITCEKRVYPCDSSPCENGGTCDNNENSFQCNCTEHYEGDTCAIKVDPCASKPCKNDAKCLSDLPSFTSSCSCPVGYEGETCEKRVYPCDHSPCVNNGICKNDGESFQCTCSEQYQGKTCEIKVDPCASRPCQNEGKCLSNLPEFKFSCSCAVGYEGETCEKRVYPCDSSPCENGGNCENNDDSFNCTCPEQYEGDSCEIRVDPCKNSPCENGGKCLSDLPSFIFSCSCPVGYQGETCKERVYPCDSSPCENDGTCENVNNTFQCKCTEEYEGATCERRGDPCKHNLCLNGGRCLSDLTQFTTTCFCAEGYQGEFCEERVYPCDSSPCKNNGTCENNEKSFKCTCPEQYEGETCEIKVDPCESSPCKNGGKCLSDFPEFTFSCTCPEGYEGETCETEVNYCGRSPCKNGGKCVNIEKGFKCECPHGFEGDRCETKVHPCKANPCENGGTCYSEISSDKILCICPAGFGGETCSEKVYPCDSSPCENGGTCENKKTAFECKCTKEFEGVTCSNRVDPCKSSPCRNGARCNIEGSEFSCECDKGFAGSTCEKEVDPCESSPCENGGICKRNGHEYTCGCKKTGYSGPNCASKGFWTTVSKLTPPIAIAADDYGDIGSRFVDLNGDGRMDLVFHRYITAKNIQKGAYLNLPGQGYVSAPQFTPPYHISADGYGDVGARFVDLNGDRKTDMVFHRYLGKNNVQKGAFLNNGDGWVWAPQYTPPFHIAGGKGNQDLGARFVELNGDGKIDFVFYRWISKRNQQKGAFLNTGDGWASAPQFTPPFHIAQDGKGDLGARFTDLNGDGKQDFIYNRWINLFFQQKGAYLNNGEKWVWSPRFTPPFYIAVDGLRDTGLRLVDFNGDGKIDIVYHRWLNRFIQQKGAYLNNGNGWTKTPSYTPPFHIAADKYGDLGARFADVNGDGLLDFVYYRWINSKKQQKGAYVNSGCGWKSEPKYTPLFHIAADGYRDLGARLVELNGDGATDFAFHRVINPTNQQKGAYLACGDTNPAFCLIYSKYCSLWKIAHEMCRLTCNTCQL